MDAATRVAELKSANVVRRIIQRLRLATLDTIDALETELFDAMEAQLEGVGSLHQKVQEEMEKGLELARKRVADLFAQQMLEESQAERPRELINEIRDLMVVLGGKVANLRDAACLGEGGAPIAGCDLNIDDAEFVQKMAADTGVEVKEFSQACVLRAAEIKEAKLPMSLKKEWTILAHEIVEVKRKAEASVTQAKAATHKATEHLRNQKLTELKASIGDQLKESMASLPVAADALVAVEGLVEPFIYGRPKEDEELLALAERVDVALAEVQGLAKSARGEMRPMGADTLLVSSLHDEALKAELQSWVAAEEKVPQIKLGLLDRRVERISNIVGRWRRERQLVKKRSVAEGQKKELLVKVKANLDAVSFDEVEPALKEAEKAVEPCSKHRTMAYEAMLEVHTNAGAAVENAKAVLDAVGKELCPIDESLDEEVKKLLKTAIAPHLGKYKTKLGLFERRLARVQTLLAQFKVELDKKRLADTEQERQLLRRVAGFFMKANELSADALFLTIAVSSGAKVALPIEDSAIIDKASFLDFFRTVDKTASKPGSPDEVETIELPEEAVAKAFASHAESEEAMTKESFVKLVSNIYTVLRATTLTENVCISGGKVLRAMRPGEVLECLDGPLPEPKAGIPRVKVRCQKDQQVGWASVSGNAGTLFLQAAS